MPSEVHFEHIKPKILDEISRAKFKLDIAVAWITDADIIKKILASLDDGIEVRILSFKDRVNKIDVFKSLYYNGANIRLSTKLMHNKFCIIDEQTVISGSFNWTVKASFNDENITIVKNENQITSRFQNEFEKLWNRCEAIDSKLEVNKESLIDLKNKFQTFKRNITTKPPYFYYVEKDYLNSQYKQRKYGNLYKGYYLIQNIEQEKQTLEYIFYAQNNLDFIEFKKALIYELRLASQRYLEVIPKLSKKNIIPIKSQFWAVCDDVESYSFKILHRISNDGTIENEKYRIALNIKGSYLVVKDGFKLLYGNGEIIDFQYDHRLAKEKEDYFYLYSTKLTDDLFLAEVQIDSRSKLRQSAIYNRHGSQITKAIFKPSFSVIKTDNNLSVFREYPVAYFNKDNDYVNFCNEKISKNFLKKWIFDYSNGKILESDIVKQNIQNSDVNISFGQDTELFFYSDKAFGNFYLALKVLKINLKKTDFNKLRKVFKEKCKIENTVQDNIELNIAKKLIFPYIEYYRKLQLQKEKSEDETQLFLKHLSGNKQNDKDYCFIATAVYGNINHPNTIEFRIFRDVYLNNNTLGRLFVKFYYRLSPFFVKIIIGNDLLIKLMRYFLNFILRLIKLRK